MRSLPHLGRPLDEPADAQVKCVILEGRIPASDEPQANLAPLDGATPVAFAAEPGTMTAIQTFPTIQRSQRPDGHQQDRSIHG